MGRLFDSPVAIIIIVLAVLLLFGGPKLPGMARNLGQSMRIFKSEVGEMKNEEKPDTKTATPASNVTTANTTDSNITINGKPISDDNTITPAPRIQ